MAYYDALVAKWPTLTGTTSEKLAAINTLTVPGPSVPVPVLTVMTYLRSNNLWMPIKASATPGAQAAVDYNDDPRVQTLDVTLPIVQGMLADLKSNSLLTQANIDAIVAMSATVKPWWLDNGYRGPISGEDLVQAGLQPAIPVTPLT